MNWDGTTWLQLFQGFGPVLGLLIFFIWRDWRREDQMALKYDRLEKLFHKTIISQRDTYGTLVAKTNAVLAQNTEQLRLTNELFKTLLRGKE